MLNGIEVSSTPPTIQRSMIDIYNDLKRDYMPEGPTDKWEVHSYLPTYEKFFGEKRGNPVKLLEIGSFTGGSLALWQDYFESDYEIHSIDIFKDPLDFSPHEDNPRYGQPSPFRLKLKSDPNMHLHHGCSSMDSIVASRFADNYFDFITEDGDHTLNGQYCTFKLYWEKLKPGGYYFIEDIRGEQYANVLAWMCRAWIMDDDLSFVNTRKNMGNISIYNGSTRTGRGDDIMLIFQKV